MRSVRVLCMEYFEQVEDYRIPGMVTYPLQEILFTVLCGVLCGLDDFDEMVMWARANQAWLRGHYAFENGIASAKTLREVLSRLHPVRFAQAFTRWAAAVTGGVAGDTVAVDGKSLRGCAGQGGTAVHTVCAFAKNAGMVLGQTVTAQKSNEITAIPELLAGLELAGCVVSIDAMGTQKTIAAQIRRQKADYLLALKGNQAGLHADVAEFFGDGEAQGITCAQTCDTGHGRVDGRAVRMCTDIAWLRERHPEWKDLNTVAEIRTQRCDKKTKTVSQAVRYYISSLVATPEELLNRTRAHWAVENNLHWCLDVTFGEDRSRIRKDHAPRNLALIRRTALNILRRDQTKGLSLKRKRLKALLSKDFLTELISS